MTLILNQFDPASFKLPIKKITLENIVSQHHQEYPHTNVKFVLLRFITANQNDFLLTFGEKKIS